MEESDADVVARSRQEPEAFGTIFERHAEPVLRFVLRRVPPDDAEALLADTFRIAFERRVDFDVARPMRPWLYGIASNLIARQYRSETRRLKAVLRLGARSVDIGDPVEGTVDAVDAARASSRVVAALGRLNDGERDVLLLYAWEELSYEEIAVTLDLPVGTVRSRLSRARQKLRARLEPPATTGAQP